MTYLCRLLLHQVGPALHEVDDHRQLEGLRWLAPEVALINATGSIVEAGRATPAPERLSSQTLIAVKRERVWRFTAFHNNRIRPMGRTVGGTLAWFIFDRLWRLLGRGTVGFTRITGSAA